MIGGKKVGFAPLINRCQKLWGIWGNGTTDSGTISFEVSPLRLVIGFCTWGWPHSNSVLFPVGSMVRAGLIYRVSMDIQRELTGSVRLLEVEPVHG